MSDDTMYLENQKLKKALAGVMPWVGVPADGPSWATDAAKARNKAACQAAFDAAAECFPTFYSGLQEVAERN